MVVDFCQVKFDRTNQVSIRYPYNPSVIEIAILPKIRSFEAVQIASYE